MAVPTLYNDFPRESKPGDYWHIFNLRLKGLSTVKRLELGQEAIRLYVEDQGVDLDEIFDRAMELAVRENPRATWASNQVEARGRVRRVLNAAVDEVIEDIATVVGGNQFRREIFLARLIEDLAARVARNKRGAKNE